MIFPKEILDNSAPVFRYRNSIRSKVIYTSIVIILIGVFFCLPLIKTDIYFTSRGIIRPVEEKLILVSPNSGLILKSNIHYNSIVSKGDTLLTLDNSRVLEELEELKASLSIADQNISDLNYLLFAQEPHENQLNLPVNRSNLIKHRQELKQIDHKIQTQKKILDRQEGLYEEKVITTVEIEDQRFEYEKLLRQRRLIIDNQKFSWQSQRKSDQENVLKLQSRLNSLKRVKNEFVLIAPVSGLLLNTKELSQGTYVTSGETLAEISPNTELVVEALIPPSKIGLLREENTISYQIDAFNYRNWGLATGHVIEIGKDIEIIDNQPVFKLLASIDQTYLQLKNGVRGDLKRGLTLSARFKITERTLFDLLYDKVDNWLNPGQNNPIA